MEDVGRPEKESCRVICVFCEGTVDAEAYVGILERHMFQSR